MRVVPQFAKAHLGVLIDKRANAAVSENYFIGLSSGWNFILGGMHRDGPNYRVVSHQR